MKSACCSSLAVLLAASLAGCGSDDSAPAPAATVGTLSIDVENVVGAAPLVLDSRSYLSPAGESFTVSTFNYYLSNVRLRRADSSEYVVPESYFLVREGRPGSTLPEGKHIVLDSIPVGSYTGISFLVGIDEERNTAGAQTGALSPANGMFWTWSQGYIFLQMEGNSPQSGDHTDHLLAYHIGGTRLPNTIRAVAPPLPAGAAIRVQAGHTPTLALRTDLLRLFTGPNPVRFGSFYTAVGGWPAGQIATNYSGSPDRNLAGTNSMFTVVQVLDN
jgi:hypothetical protein